MKREREKDREQGRDRDTERRKERREKDKGKLGPRDDGREVTREMLADDHTE